MATVEEIFTADDMPPIGVVNHNLVIWTQGRWQPYTIEWFEQMPRSEPFTTNFGTLAAQTTGQATLVTNLQLDEDELLQVRLQPIDDFEVRVWLTRSQGRFVTKNVHAHVTPFTAAVDPYFKSSSVFVLGKERDAYFELRNVTDYALAQTRVHYWGYRFSLRKLGAIPERATWIVAEGRK